jgi:hypothetical protein
LGQHVCYVEKAIRTDLQLAAEKQSLRHRLVVLARDVLEYLSARVGISVVLNVPLPFDETPYSVTSGKFCVDRGRDGSGDGRSGIQPAGASSARCLTSPGMAWLKAVT